MVLGPSYFSQDVVFYGYFYRYYLQQHFVVCAQKMINKRNPHAWAIGHARSARPPGRPDEQPDEQPDERASYLCSLRPGQAEYLSRLRQQAHNWGGGSVSRGCDPRACVVCCWCLLLPECCCCCCCFDDDCSSCFFHLVTFRTGMITINSTVSIFLSIMQSPAPTSSLAEPPLAASPQLGRWICQQGLRSARIRGLLLVLAAASAAAAAAAASMTTAIAFLRLVTFLTGMTVLLLLLLLRLQPGRDSRHTLYALIRVVARGTAW